METLIAAKEWNKVYRQDGTKYRMKVRGELRSLGGQAPRFSITGEIQSQAKNNKWVDECGGCIHEEILMRLPQLHPLVIVHLATENGVPLHAYSNAAYWAKENNIEMLASHLATATDTAQRMCDYATSLQPKHTPMIAWEMTCEHFSMLKIWKNQAAWALALLQHNTEGK
jgi:hypothetical protein